MTVIEPAGPMRPLDKEAAGRWPLTVFVVAPHSRHTVARADPACRGTRLAPEERLRRDRSVGGFRAASGLRVRCVAIGPLERRKALANSAASDSAGDIG